MHRRQNRVRILVLLAIFALAMLTLGGLASAGDPASSPSGGPVLVR